jgi:SNF2 family DNA or RNA helicase
VISNSASQSKYNKLTQDQKTLLQVKSVLFHPIDDSTLYNLLRKMNIGKSNGAYFSEHDSQMTLASLTKAGITNQHHEILDPFVLHEATKEALKKNQIKDRLHILQSAYPEIENGKSHSERTLRDFRLSLYQGLSFRAISAEDPSNNAVMITPLLKKIAYTLPIDISWVKRLKPGFSPFIINLLLKSGLSHLADVDLLVEHARGLCKTSTNPNPTTLQLIAEYDISQADPYPLAEFIKDAKIKPIFKASVATIVEMFGKKEKDLENLIDNNQDKYINALEKYLASQQKLDSFELKDQNNPDNSTESIFFILGLFSLVSLLQTNLQNNPDNKDEVAEKLNKNLKLINKILKAYKDQNTYRFKETLTKLMQLSQLILIQNNFKPAVKTDNLAVHAPNKLFALDNLDDLLASLIDITIKSEIADAQVASFHEQFDSLEGKGYLFYCGLIDQALRTHTPNSHIQQHLRPLQSKLGWANPVIPKMTGSQAMELEQLMPSVVDMVNQIQAAKVYKKAKRRLVWYFNEAEVEISAIEQKETESKSGKSQWSRGRKVSLSDIIDHEAHFPYLKEDDLAICKALERKSANFKNYNTYSYEWDKDKLLRALINHPRIYHNRYKATKLNFRAKAPEIFLTKDKSQDKFIPQHNVDDTKDNKKISFEAIDSNTYNIILPADNILEALKQSSQNNALSEQNLKDLALEIGGNTDFYTDSPISNLKIDKASNTLNLLLTPNEQKGLDASIRIRPLLNLGPYIIPGDKPEFIIATDNNKLSQFQRDIEKETQDASSLLQQLGQSQDNNLKYDFSFDNPQDCLDFLAKLEKIEQPEIKISWPQGQKRQIKGELSAANLSLKLLKKGHWFEAEGEVVIDAKTKISMNELINKLSQRQGDYIELAPGEFVSLNKHFIEKLQQIDLLTEKQQDARIIHEAHAAAFDTLTDDLEQIEKDESWNKQINLFKEPAPEIDLSKLNAELRSYQIDGIKWLNRLSHWGLGACLADDMGLGKTIQAIGILISRSKLGPQLVIAPTSVCYNWELEILKFAPSLSPKLLSEYNRQDLINNCGNGDIIIASYGLLQHAGMLLKDKDWGTIILDEAQAIKNSKTKRAKMALQLKSDCRICLTGTPIENHLHELWSIFQFLNPGFLGNHTQFMKKFIKPIELLQDNQSTAVLKQLINPFVLRRHKTEVLKDLPKKTEQIISIELSDEEMAFYENLRESAVNHINTLDAQETVKGGQRRIHILSEITRLRQACCHPEIIEPLINMPSSKLKMLESMVTELIENDHKVLIFSQFVGYLAHVQDSLRELKIDYHYLDGSTPQSQRKDIVEAFQGGEKSVFVLSLKAGGVGLNLTQADYVIILDPWWNPAVETQAADRAHRIGQERPVTLYRLICKNTIEEKMIALHKRKKDLSDSLLEGTQKTGALSEGELLALIQREE